MEINAFLEHQEQDTENVKLVKELYKAMYTWELAAILQLLVESPTWDVCPGWPDGGVFSGRDEVFGVLYNIRKSKLLSKVRSLHANPEVFIDGGDVVTVLGFYSFTTNEDDLLRRVRFSHTWKIAPDGYIAGVWQVADSHALWEYINS